ncbi:MAG: hypothetical protein K2L42_03300 [Clostridia bacterium]|nr:hypothetical protein [Clostridia bacterium]
MKVIKLKSNGLGRYEDVSPFLVTDNRLEIKVELPSFNGEFYLITENNGKTDKRLLPQDGTVTIEGLTAGELNASVKHYVKGALIREYKVEPLLLKEADGNLSAMPELAGLKAALNALGQEYAALSEELSKYKEKAAAQIERLNNNVSALILFAYKDYNTNVFLGGGTVDGFVNGFGFALGEEEIKLLNGGNKND